MPALRTSPASSFAHALDVLLSVVAVAVAVPEGRSCYTSRPSLRDLCDYLGAARSLLRARYLHSSGFGFEAENGPALMQLPTSSASFGCFQALKKSACMVEYVPEESVGLPRVVGMGN